MYYVFQQLGLGP